jgi:hypothetical protein
LDMWGRGERQAVIRDQRLHIPARLYARPPASWGSRQAASEGGVSVTAEGSRIMVGLMSRTARCNTPCVKGGTHPTLPYYCDHHSEIIVFHVTFIQHHAGYNWPL